MQDKLPYKEYTLGRFASAHLALTRTRNTCDNPTFISPLYCDDKVKQFLRLSSCEIRSRPGFGFILAQYPDEAKRRRDDDELVIIRPYLHPYDMYCTSILQTSRDVALAENPKYSDNSYCNSATVFFHSFAVK